MHDGPLAMVPYALLSMAALLTAAVCVLTVLYRLRRAHLLLGAAASTLLAVWFALLAISAGPAPLWSRGELADALRWLALAIWLAWIGWLTIYGWSMVRVERITHE